MVDRGDTKGPVTHLGTHLGIELVSVEPERVVMRMAHRVELQRGGGIFHGGAIMALADHVAGCLFNTDPRVAAAGNTGLTIDFSMSFLRAVPPGEALVAEGTVLRRGRKIVFMAITIRGEASQKDVAVARTTYVTVPAANVGTGRR
jgi:1,4-dihydroxy-2-naphthoyl-CoA hydrolase